MRRVLLLAAWFTELLALGAPKLHITPAPLPAATVGVAYSQTLAATGGAPPYHWSVIAGALPGGLTLQSSGSITGTPSSAGMGAFTTAERTATWKS